MIMIIIIIIIIIFIYFSLFYVSTSCLVEFSCRFVATTKDTKVMSSEICSGNFKAYMMMREMSKSCILIIIYLNRLKSVLVK